MPPGSRMAFNAVVNDDAAAAPRLYSGASKTRHPQHQTTQPASEAPDVERSSARRKHAIHGREVRGL